MEETVVNGNKLYHGKNIPIQLCNICNTQGDFTPRWFRFEDQEHQIHTVQVLGIVSRKEINFSGIKMLQFICKTDDECDADREHLVELRYNISTHRWIFYQVLA